MKKIITTAIMAAFAFSAFALDLSVGLNGNIKADNSGKKGPDFGGGVGLNLNIINGFGVQVESNISTVKIVSASDGVSFSDAFAVDIPVMAFYNLDLDRFVFGGGLGVDCSMVQEKDVKMALAAGLNAKVRVSDNVYIKAGATGVLDCFPSLSVVNNGSYTTLKADAADFSRSSVTGYLGAEYRFRLTK